MSIDWSALGEVTAVSIGATVAVAVVFALGVRVLSGPGSDGEPLTRTADAAGIGGGTPETGESPSAGTGRAPGAVFVAGLCFLACLAAVAYGLYLIIPQFR